MAPCPLSSKLCFDCRAVDRGYDADWFREVLIDKGTKPCILGKSHARKPSSTPFVTLFCNALPAMDKRRDKRRNRIERVFGRLKDWRRGATRYDRSPPVFL